jgi:pimeloyl-ACP methyl ester carboxylesterase
MSKTFACGLLALALCLGGESRADGAEPAGYLAVPKSGHGRGVLVLHPWWGLNDTIMGFCDRLAAEGFVAFAPDLYHGKIATTIPEAEALSGGLDEAKAMADVASAAAHLATRADPGGIGLVGFSMGAGLGLPYSKNDPERVRAVLVFYGTRRSDYALQRFVSRPLRGVRPVRAEGGGRHPEARAARGRASGDVPHLQGHRALVLRARSQGRLRREGGGPRVEADREVPQEGTAFVGTGVVWRSSSSPIFFRNALHLGSAWKGRKTGLNFAAGSALERHW